MIEQGIENQQKVSDNKINIESVIDTLKKSYALWEEGNIDKSYEMIMEIEEILVNNPKSKEISGINQILAYLYEMQLIIGYEYHKGEKVKENPQRALELFGKSEKGMSDGNYLAQFLLGDCYYNGKGVEKNYGLAVEWLTKAANQGYAQAQMSLGNCYYNSCGVEKDYGLAVEWWTKAANQNYAVGYMYNKIVQPVNTEKERLVRKWKQESTTKSSKRTRLGWQNATA